MITTREIRAAMRKSSVWGTAVPCGAGDGVLILPSATRKETIAATDDLAGSCFPHDGDFEAVRVGGSISMHLRYDGCDVPLALVMGLAEVSVSPGNDVCAYTFSPAADVDGLFATFVEHMRSYVLEIPSLKITGFTLGGEVGGALTLTLRVLGIDRIHDSVVNTPASFPGVTYPETGNRVRFSQGIFRMNDLWAAPLGPGDEIFPSSFEFTFQRRLKGEYSGGCLCGSGEGTRDLIGEPTNDGPPEMSLQLRFPRHTSPSYLATPGGEAGRKMDITFTGAPIEAGCERTFALIIPHLQLINDNPVDEDGIIAEPLEFRVLAPETPPPGMKDITDPFRITGVNLKGTNAL